MKDLLINRFTAILAVILSMGGVAGAQTSKFAANDSAQYARRVVSPAAERGNSSRTAPKTPIENAFDYYFKIQKALAQDSLKDLAANAHGLAQAVRQDTTGAFPAALGPQADALARQVTLAGARLSFAIVSGQLINSLKARPGMVKDVRQVHGPKTRLDWLQKGDQVQNPYLGKAMERVGTFVR